MEALGCSGSASRYFGHGSDRGLGSSVSADDTDATAIVDKAMKALGGEEKLRKIEAATWKTKGMTKLGDNEDHEFTGSSYHAEASIAFDRSNRSNSKAKSQGRGDPECGQGLAHGRRHALAARRSRCPPETCGVPCGDPGHVHAMKGKAFKVKAAGEELVGGQPAVVLKVTCPDGNDISISFDKASGLPVKAVGKVFALDGQELTQETTYSDYKDFGGIKTATKLESKIDGKPDRKHEVTEFKILDKVDPLTFFIPMEAAARRPRRAPFLAQRPGSFCLPRPVMCCSTSVEISRAASRSVISLRSSCLL